MQGRAPQTPLWGALGTLNTFLGHTGHPKCLSRVHRASQTPPRGAAGTKNTSMGCKGHPKYLHRVQQAPKTPLQDTLGTPNTSMGHNGHPKITSPGCRGCLNTSLGCTRYLKHHGTHWAPQTPMWGAVGTKNTSTGHTGHPKHFHGVHQAPKTPPWGAPGTPNTSPGCFRCPKITSPGCSGRLNTSLGRTRHQKHLHGVPRVPQTPPASPNPRLWGCLTPNFYLPDPSTNPKPPFHGVVPPWEHPLAAASPPGTKPGAGAQPFPFTPDLHPIYTPQHNEGEAATCPAWAQRRFPSSPACRGGLPRAPRPPLLLAGPAPRPNFVSPGFRPRRAPGGREGSGRDLGLCLEEPRCRIPARRRGLCGSHLARGCSGA